MGHQKGQNQPNGKQSINRDYLKFVEKSNGEQIVFRADGTVMPNEEWAKVNDPLKDSSKLYYGIDPEAY